MKVDNSPFFGAWLADVLLPARCVVCGAQGQSRGFDLCAACERELPAIQCGCDRCGVPLPASTGSGRLCGECLRTDSPVTSTRCAFLYAWPVHHLLRDLKYQRALCHARVLGTLLSRRLERSDAGSWPQVVCPVPLGRRRFVARGFNQASEIGRVVARTLRIPMRCDLIVRVRETSEQSGLGRDARRTNVREAFAVTGSTEYRHVAVVDDVVTTGNTVREIARVLAAAGVGRIDVWAVARAVR